MAIQFKRWAECDRCGLKAEPFLNASLPVPVDWVHLVFPQPDADPEYLDLCAECLKALHAWAAKPDA